MKLREAAGRVGEEHEAKAAQHCVEAAILERERLPVRRNGTKCVETCATPRSYARAASFLYDSSLTPHLLWWCPSGPYAQPEPSYAGNPLGARPRPAHLGQLCPGVMIDFATMLFGAP
jgi:hypothetical protein